MQRIPAEDRFTNALQAVLDYLWDDEAANYDSRAPQEKRGHIFAQLKTLQAWLCTPKQMLDKSYHTVAPRCLLLMHSNTEAVTASAVTTFTNSLCAFAVETRPVSGPVSVTTCAANHRAFV